MAGIIGMRGPDIEKRDALRGYKVEWKDADRPLIRPHTGAPILTIRDGKPEVSRHVFGFSTRFSSFNARDDKLTTGKAWSRMYRKGHGVAPVSYMLEWADLGDGKRPYRIERADGTAMAVPALVGPSWEKRDDPAFALVTIRPNRFVKKFHDRMIAQLPDDHVDVWLRPAEHSARELAACLKPPPDDELVAHPMAPAAGKARFDDAGALASTGPPISWADLRPASRRR